MKRRCNNPRDESYQNYGARGISVCEAWSRNYAAFRGWALSHGYRQGLTIDRINNDGQYDPSNCRVVARVVNNRNRRTTRRLTAFGETKTLAEWSQDARCAVGYGALAFRVRSGYAAERAITQARKGAA
jgi:hypothetical protein